MGTLLEKDAAIFVAGHKGLVGSAIVRRLEQGGYSNILVATRDELDLCNQAQVRDYFSRVKPAYVFVAAAKVGGIHANNAYPAEFIYDNLVLECNVIDAAYRAGVKQLLFLGSSCIYPKLCPQPMKEEYLLTGALEPTNEPYAIAKIAGVKMCEAYNRQYGTQYVSLMPTNLYGPNDNFHPENSHVLPALIRRIHEAQQSGVTAVTIWGSGTPRREFLYVDDLADACVFLMETNTDVSLVNVGVGVDLSIKDLAVMIQRTLGYEGDLVFDRSKPDGTPRKLLDVSRLATLGWKAQVDLDEGLRRTCDWYLQQTTLRQ